MFHGFQKVHGFQKDENGMAGQIRDDPSVLVRSSGDDVDLWSGLSLADDRCTVAVCFANVQL
jgi:hypothetical protein